MATTLNLLVFLFFTTLIQATPPVHNGISTATPKGVTLQLMHRFSPSLAFHRVDNFEKFLERTEKQRPHAAAFQQEATQVNLVAPTEDHLFFVNLSIGNPPIRLYLAMDTGSRYTWVIGRTRIRKNKYSPAGSSTQRYLSRDDSACKKLYQCKPQENVKDCMCVVGYADGQTSEIKMGSDQFVFNNVTVKKVVMGLINFNPKGKFFGQDDFQGILGLSPRYPSFTNWLTDFGANKFSYYINGAVTKSSHPYATLMLGDLADIDGDNSTPLRLDGAHYQVTLKSITVGVIKLDIDPKVFVYTGDEGASGVTIDTGTVITYLTNPACYQLFGGMGEALESRGFRVDMINRNNVLCFYGSLEELKRSGFPVVSFHFAQGATLRLNEDDLFMRKRENYVCSTVKMSSFYGDHLKYLTIIGLTAQQDYVMGFDLENLRLSMKLRDR